MAAGGPGTLPLLRPRGLVSMTTPTANWPELLKAVVLEVLGTNPQTPGYDMQEPERKHGGDRQSIWRRSLPKRELPTTSSMNPREELRAMEILTLTLHKAKETKNKVVYGTGDGSVIQSVYIDRDALGDAPPATIQMVISAQ